MPKDDTTERRLQELERRVTALESRASSLGKALSHARLRRKWLKWLRPPLWIFEQYKPRKLSIKPSYQQVRSPPQAPTISIVTPTYNYARYLPATIESVLTQDYPSLCYHVQDGGSRDSTSDILRSYASRLTWASEADAGQAQAVNRGFTVVGDSDVMAYLNSDDVLMPGTLAYVARAFQARPDVDLFYGHRIFIDRDGSEIGRAVLPPHDPERLYWADYIPQETLFWRRRVWDKVGPIDESFQYALDWDFILRAQAAGFKFERLPRFLACFRVHDQQKTASMYDIGRDEMQRLRCRYLRFEPTQRQISTAISWYLVRQLGYHWMYRLGILRH